VINIEEESNILLVIICHNWLPALTIIGATFHTSSFYKEGD